MFVLYTINNILVIKPSDLVGGSNEILYKTLQAKYLFKILEGEGLCVEILGFTIKECVIVNGQGDYQYDVEVKLVIFRAHKDEILVGEVEKCVLQGIIVSFGFTKAFIPASGLNQPNRYDKKERTWIWMPEGPENLEFEYTKGDKIRFQVESTHYQKTAVEIEDENYYLVGNCEKDGLGMLSFW